MRRLWAGLVVGAVLAGAGGCSDGGDDPAVATTTTGAPAPSTTTTAAPAPVPQPTGQDAIDALLDAWRNGNRPAALVVASPTAVDALFAIPPEAGQARGCNAGGANVNVQCVFRLSAGELQVRAAPTAGGRGYLVDFVILGS